MIYVILMNQSTLPTIVVIITAIVALLLFALSDHSGFSINDCTFEEDHNQNGSYNLTYTLLVGRHFDHVDCQYTIYDKNNSPIKKGSTKLKELYIGSFPISDIVSFSENENTNFSRVEIVVYTQAITEENGVNRTSMEKSYAKSFNL